MSKPSDPNTIPEPRNHLLLKNAPEIDADAPVQSLARLARELGPIYRFATPLETWLMLSSHELVADACDQSRFDKSVNVALQQVRDFTHDGLFTAYTDEPNWGKAHRILMPAFSPMAMRDYFDYMLDIADQMCTKWERFGPETVIDVVDNMTRLTLDTIGVCGFGYRFNSFYQREMHPFVEAMVRALQEAGHRMQQLPLQTKLQRSANRQYDADIAFMHTVTSELLAKRRTLAAADVPRDLLTLMLTAQDPVTGEVLDDENIQAQLVTFLIAGHETTSGLLTAALYLLMRHPEQLERARAVVDEVLGSEMPRFEHLAKLGYIDQVLRETLRMHPPVGVFGVYAKEDTTLAGRYPVAKDDILMLLTILTHRDPAVWPDPDRFDPDRFAPDAMAHIPEHAWKPFGNGQRSCIGYAFALQEATLVLAMVLQRFEISEPAPYDLVIRETLTLKPQGFKIQVRLRKPIQRGVTTKPVATAVPTAKEAAASAAHGTPLLLLYGSNSGASEAFARQIASDGAARGYDATVAPLDDYTGMLPKDRAVTIVTASYNGQPPDNAAKFCTWLSGVPSGSLAGVRYAVFGCGNRDWAPTYQAVPKSVDEHLQQAGAHAFMQRGEGDARGDFFGDFDRWYAPYWDTLNTALGVTASAVDTGPLYDVEEVPSSRATLIREQDLDYATLAVNRELVDMSSPLGRSKRHLEFSLPAGDMYAAGDYLAILPVNHPELVQRAAQRFGLRTDAGMVLRSTRGAHAASLPTDRPIVVEDLLGRYVELSAPATVKNVARLAEKSTSAQDSQELAAIAADHSRYQEEILNKRVSVLDLLEDHPSCELSFAEFLEMLPAMRVRQYSISSSPRDDPTRCSVTVAVVDAPAWSGHGQFHGTASSYLARREVGDRVPVAIRTPNVPFHPPAANDTPVIMVGAGTGVAPFRGFLQERAYRSAHGEETGTGLLFFGCDHPDVDFLYHEEMDGWARDGIVEVFPAFYRKPDGDVTFVQHRLWQERERVRAAFRQGAVVYVCGDGEHMAPAVRDTLAKIYQEAAACSDKDADEWLHDMEREGRYVPDVFA
ncbi:bifunctional cytochrome P450/NADPH--P450 reductase [Catellatospora paridis]|uniref:bifunctional cytochrome P450/NADPH--P450 reductase n=1 Tax=Catellatospora paridis TaxID=1617086 RepID=UPI0012D3D0FE|nr:cytochrome P450 [Catellatospora paridis]